jgi:hypothetical protein
MQCSASASFLSSVTTRFQEGATEVVPSFHRSFVNIALQTASQSLTTEPIGKRIGQVLSLAQERVFFCASSFDVIDQSARRTRYDK